MYSEHKPLNFICKIFSIFTEKCSNIVCFSVPYFYFFRNIRSEVVCFANTSSFFIKQYHTPCNLSCSIFNYLLYFFTCILFYALSISSHSVVYCENLKVNLLLFPSPPPSSDSVITNFFSFYLSLIEGNIYSLCLLCMWHDCFL